MACVSCINEHYEDFHNELQLTTAFSWLTISDEQKKVIRKLDNCEDILFKCDYYKNETRRWYNPESHYGKAMEAVEKLKASDKIFLSRVGENDYYKIGFVYDNKEYVTFELKHPISWRDFKFISLKGELPERVGLREFNLVTDKHEAKELLATCNTKYYPDGVLDFMNIILN